MNDFADPFKAKGDPYTDNKPDYCTECLKAVGYMHEPSCGKRVINCPAVVEDDCHE